MTAHEDLQQKAPSIGSRRRPCPTVEKGKPDEDEVKNKKRTGLRLLRHRIHQAVAVLLYTCPRLAEFGLSRAECVIFQSFNHAFGFLKPT